MDGASRSRLGLSLQTQAQGPTQNKAHNLPPLGTEASLSTAPASPLERTDQLLLEPTSPPPLNNTRQRMNSPPSAPPYSALGQISFAPATQQTVVTTTTTTTVSLPPLLIRPPQDIATRDPKQYPLAFSPTPHSIKNFCVDLAGQSVVYREADDAQDALGKYDYQQRRLRAMNGSMRKEERFPSTFDHSSNRTSRNPSALTNVPKRSTSPPSLAEAAELAGMHRRKRKPRSLLSRQHSASSNGLFNGQPHLAHTAATLHGPSPVTPDTDAGISRPITLDADNVNAHEPYSRSRLQRVQDWQTERPQERAVSAAGASKQRLGAPFVEEDFYEEQGATATPPIAETELDVAEPTSVRPQEYRRPIPPSLITGSQLDASLPSPSLSPVTAAANLARSQQFLTTTSDGHDDGNASDVSGLDLEDPAKVMPAPRLTSSMPESALTNARTRQSDTGLKSPSSMTVMDIPTMIDAFDSLPDEMQTYVLYQMLRRCPKKTLQTVASVVNPALKCDPFDVLPVELGLQITKHLDFKSLCQAAQVSKRWRQLIDSDERAWKELIDKAGFNLPEGEIERAVREGWGWQCPGVHGFEQDLSVPKSAPQPTLSRMELDCLSPGGGAPSVSSDDATSSAPTRLTRLKRKSTAPATSHKRQKRKASRRQEESPLWLLDLELANGPIAYASAAAKAVPNPCVGLPSLANLHLFKSIYQRHYMVSKGWMDPESLPQHLAFRAHHRHVVTCLLFDHDKILTGSDDTNINVYDTKTGVLRKRLEGHEGGVWALQYEGDTLVSGSTDRSVRVWDIPSGRCLQTFQGHTSTVRCLVILKPAKIGTNPDGTPIMMPNEPIIITGSRDSTLRVWKLPRPGDPEIHQAGPPPNDNDNPYSLRVLQGHSNSVRAIAAHGDTLVSGSYDHTVRVWKISTGELLHRLSGHTQKVYSVVLDHERGRCISGSMDNLVKVWSIESGACLFNLEGHTSLVGLLDLSHNRLVSAAADSTLRIWHPETGHCLNKLMAHTGAITCFQHDDQKVISGSDRTLKMWNVETGKCIRDLLTDLSGVWQVRFDERRCVAAVQRNNLTYIEVLDFGAARDGVSEVNRGRRIVVDHRGREVEDVESASEVQILAPV